ncbi:hypothetical protein [Roseateles sp. YR242]|uniref:hypothetical protein n=1 Tax=Roseateles sp. YR242 TaxID=1855305 RepID=UPI002101905E|nr:hypothetical protein [Roseateles sp. YR242]
MMKLSASSSSSALPARRRSIFRLPAALAHTSLAHSSLAQTSLVPAALVGLLLLTGCDQLGIEDPAKVAAAKEAEGKAIGGACRNAMRAIEDCYALNPKAQKASIYEGWREMDEYMRENKLEGTRPLVANPAASKPAEPASDSDDTEESAKPAKGEKSGKGGKSSH